MTTLVVGSGVQVTVSPGDILTVEMKLVYTVPAPITASLWVSLYIPPGRDYTIMTEIPLVAGTDQVWEGSVSVPITDDVGLRNYTYDLLVELPDYNLQATESQAVVVTGMTTGTIGGIFELVGMMIVVMMLGMVMNIMTEPEGFTVGAKKEYEKVKGAVQPIVQIFK